MGGFFIWVGNTKRFFWLSSPSLRIKGYKPLTRPLKPCVSFINVYLIQGVIDVALSIKQEKFCLEYAKLGNARQAYINAGYKNSKDSTTDVNACRLLKNDKVKARLAELAEDAKNNAIADIQEMQKKLTEIIRQSAEEEVVVVENIGDFTSEARLVKKKPAIKDVISAIDKLGRMQGAFNDKSTIEVALPVVISGADELED